MEIRKYETVGDFIEEWQHINDWLPHQIFQRTKENRQFMIEDGFLLMQDTDCSWKWLTVAQAKVKKVEEPVVEEEKHWLTKSAEQLVKNRDVYKHQTWHHENVDLYSMFYGALTSIMEHKHTAATKVKEVKAMMKAFEDAKKIIRD